MKYVLVQWERGQITTEFPPSAFDAVLFRLLATANKQARLR